MTHETDPPAVSLRSKSESLPLAASQDPGVLNAEPGASQREDLDPDDDSSQPSAARSLFRSIAKRPLVHRQMEVIAREQIERTRHDGQSLALLSIAIDRVERAGGASGLPAALVLREFAKVCASQLRGGDIVGKVDDTTFVALMPGTDSKGALRIAERLRTAIAAVETPASGGRLRHITVSIGVVATRTGRTTYRALRSRADAKRDDAQGSGGNRVNA